MKRLTSLAAMLLCSLLTFAQNSGTDNGTDVTMYVLTTNSKEAASYSLDDLKKITFGDKGIQIWHTQWPTEYSYSTVRVLSFNGSSAPDTPAAIRPAVSNASEHIYDLQGRKQKNLKKGVNIVRQKNGTVRKVLIK